MKVAILIAYKLGSSPIAELGGLVMNDGEQVLVKEAEAKVLQQRYPKKLIQAGVMEVPSLRQGNYEYLGRKKPETALAPEGGNDEANVSEIAADKSLIGKGRRKVK